MPTARVYSLGALSLALALEFGHGQRVFTNGDPAELAQLPVTQLPGTSTQSL